MNSCMGGRVSRPTYFFFLLSSSSFSLIHSHPTTTNAHRPWLQNRQGTPSQGLHPAPTLMGKGKKPLSLTNHSTTPAVSSISNRPRPVSSAPSAASTLPNPSASPAGNSLTQGRTECKMLILRQSVNTMTDDTFGADSIQFQLFPPPTLQAHVL